MLNFFVRDGFGIEKIDSFKIRRGDRKCLCANMFVHLSHEIKFRFGVRYLKRTRTLTLRSPTTKCGSG